MRLIQLTAAFVLCSITGFFHTVRSQDQPPVVYASGDQLYCPGSTLAVVTDFDISDPDPLDTGNEGVFVQISEGYVNGEDVLTLSGSHPTLVADWNPSQGKLEIRGITGQEVPFTELVAAVKDIVYESSNPSPTGSRSFSITLSTISYLPATGHFYEYVPSDGITWTQAFAQAAMAEYFGLQGYLATIISEEEATLVGEQAQGTGWIGGSDAGNEGTWTWRSGPEEGEIFWVGRANGSTPTYANWNRGEPNNSGESEHYAHITDPTVGNLGSWNDLPDAGNGNSISNPYYPRGYIVEYGGLPGDPELFISGKTLITMPQLQSTQGGTTCGTGSVYLNATASSGTVFWYDSPNASIPVASGDSFSTPLLSTTKTYYVSAAAQGCTTGIRVPVEATVLADFTIDNSVTLKNCDEDGNADGFTNFNLNEATPFITLGNPNLNTSFYQSLADADTGTDPLNPDSYNNSSGNVIYARVEAANGCYKTAEITLEVSTTSFPPDYLFVLEACEEDEASGKSTFDLTQAIPDILSQFPAGQNLSVHFYFTEDEAVLEENEITNTSTFNNTVPTQQFLFVRVESEDNGDCYGLGPYLELEVYSLPVFEIRPEGFFCTTDDSYLLETFSPAGSYTYKWTDENENSIGTTSSIIVTQSGIYNVIATNSAGCASPPRQVEIVQSEAANLSLENIRIRDNSDSNSITIINTESLGMGDYEFSLDGLSGPYQDEPVFNQVAAGVHILYVRDKNGCGISVLEIPVLGFPKYFTPNNDGYHDVWMPLGVNRQLFVKSSVLIYDRYGKLLKSLYGFDQSWDGTFRGVNLPSTDYWYKALLEDSDGNRLEQTGHFSLKR